MKKLNPKLFLLFSLVLLGYMITGVNCLDFDDIPTQIGISLGISTFAGGILISIIFISMFTLPLMFSKSSKIMILSIIIGIPCLCFCVAVTWLPVWVLLLISLMVAGIYAGIWKKVFS